MITLLDIMRVANAPAGQNNENLDGEAGMLGNSFDPITGEPLPGAANTLEGYVVQNIRFFFAAPEFQDEPLSERIRYMVGALSDAATDLRRIAGALEVLAGRAEESEIAPEDVEAVA